MAFGKLSNAASVANTNVIAYTVPSNALYAELDINILNTGVASSIIQLALSAANAPTADEYIESGATIPANGGILDRTSVKCSPGERIIINADNSDCIIRISGKVFVE